MIAVDTNVLIFAHRAESASHAVANARLTDLARGDAPWAVPVFCLAEFVRVVTHRRVFNPPTAVAGALEFIEALLRVPTVRLLLPSEEFPKQFARVVAEARAVGNLIFDAQIAAVCREHSIREILTADRDFARFANLEPIYL